MWTKYPVERELKEDLTDYILSTVQAFVGELGPTLISSLVRMQVTRAGPYHSYRLQPFVMWNEYSTACELITTETMSLPDTTQLSQLLKPNTLKEFSWTSERYFPT